MKQLIIKLFLVLILSNFWITLIAGGETIGGRSAALGNASVSLSDFWSIQNNPAGMALQPYLAAGVYYENQFFLKALSLKSAAIVAPTRLGVLGLSFNQFGFNLYNENKFGLAYAKSFGELLRIGLQLDYQTTNFTEDYVDAGFMTFELGIQSTLNEKISLGAYVYNPIRLDISAFPGQKVPMIMRFGLTYTFTKEFIGVAEIEKNFEQKVSLRLGLEYVIQERFFVRTGIDSNPGIYTIGAGIHFKRLQLHIAASMHQILGVSTQAGLTYQFIKSDSDE
jgi:hypothetical protein